MTRSRFILLVLIVSLCRISEAASPSTPAEVEFDRDIRPILSDACFFCHGPDSAKRKADLRLDTEQGALRQFKGGRRPIVPGDPEKSEIIRRMLTEDPDEKMPPPDSHRTITPQQIEKVKQWVRQGAHWQQHWAFVAPKRPHLPLPNGAGAKAEVIWPRNPIDAFVLTRLQKEGLKPSPQAARETLIRRVTLDLTGLPPTPGEVDAFLADTSPNAYENLVERLLACPRYGQRMAQEWLDAARYADTNGYQGDRTRTLWPWRDWVIASMNHNLSFDRFTVEQIAGDLLSNPTPDQLIATGFNRNHPLNGEGGRIPEESRVEYCVDRVNTTGAVWLGLTVGCTQCHDHKYDPLLQKEFYQLYSYFNSIDESGAVDADGNANPVLRLPTAQQQQRQDQLNAELADLQNQTRQINGRLSKAQTTWEAQLVRTLSTSRVQWSILKPVSVSADQQTLTILDDHSVLASSKEASATDNYTVVLDLPVGGPGLTGLQLEGLPHEAYRGLTSRSPQGNFILTAFKLTLKTPDGAERPVSIADARASFEEKGLPIFGALDDNPATGWGVHDGKNHLPKLAWFRFAQPLSLPAGGRLTARLEFHHQRAQHHMGRLRLAVTTVDDPFHQPPPDPILTLVKLPPDQRSTEQSKQLADYYRSIDPQLRQVQSRITALSQMQASLDQQTLKTMVMRERAQPRDTFILIRGGYDKYGEKVTGGVPASLPPLPPGAPNNRLGFAQWLVHPSHPLTARVTLNRYWQHFFGIGLVKTAEDFGLQGERPIHRDLLDWLATEFIRTGWDVKAMHRLIVTSATYRQSSDITPQLLDKDPDNRWLARGPRHRLPSFQIRDQALAAAGLLVETIGGPSVKPYQPPGIWEEVSFNTIRYEQDHGDSLYRRSLYIFWRRTVGPTMFFDTSSRQVCIVKQTRTNTPLQSLIVMNETGHVETTRVLAQRLLSDPSLTDPRQRITHAFRLALARKPTDRELTILMNALQRLTTQYQQDRSAAEQLVAVGEYPKNPKLDPIQIAAHAGLVSLIFNLDQTQTKE